MFCVCLCCYPDVVPGLLFRIGKTVRIFIRRSVTGLLWIFLFAIAWRARLATAILKWSVLRWKMPALQDRLIWPNWWGRVTQRPRWLTAQLCFIANRHKAGNIRVVVNPAEKKSFGFRSFFNLNGRDIFNVSCVCCRGWDFWDSCRFSEDEKRQPQNVTEDQFVFISDCRWKTFPTCQTEFYRFGRINRHGWRWGWSSVPYCRP